MKKRRKEKENEERFSRSMWVVSLILKGFPKVLREWIPGFGSRKEERQRGSNRESYMYERCMLLPFLLRLSLPLMFVASF